MSSRLADREHAVYRFYDNAGELLYVGMTCDFAQRRAQHRATQPWWSDVDESRTVLEHHHTQDCARMAEAAAIAREAPRHNSPHWLPKGFLSHEDAHQIRAARAHVVETKAAYRAAVLAALADGASFAEMATLTGLSTNTLQRWKRESTVGGQP